MIAFFLSRSLPPNSEGSAEPCEAIGACLRTQVRTCNTYNLCLASSLFPVLFYSCIPDRLLRPFKNDGQVFNTVLQETVFHICSHLPLPSTCRLTPSPTSGDSLRLIFFQFLLTFTASLRSSKNGSLAYRQAGTAYILHVSLLCKTYRNGLHFLFCSLCTHVTVNTFIKLDCFLP